MVGKIKQGTPSKAKRINFLTLIQKSDLLRNST